MPFCIMEECRKYEVPEKIVPALFAIFGMNWSVISTVIISSHVHTAEMMI